MPRLGYLALLLGMVTTISAPALAADLDVRWDPHWPQLPGSGSPASSMQEVRAAYAFAARHPELTDKLACYCGCHQSHAHNKLTDCFVRDHQGDRIVWDSMGYG